MPEGFEPKVQPHGNSKQDKPYYPTLPSTLEAIANDSGGPKDIVSKVSTSVGGVLACSDPCSLPLVMNSRLQMSNVGSLVVIRQFAAQMNLV